MGIDLQSGLVMSDGGQRRFLSLGELAGGEESLHGKGRVLALFKFGVLGVEGVGVVAGEIGDGLLIFGAAGNEENQQRDCETQIFQLMHIGSFGGGKKGTKIPACSSAAYSCEN